MDANISRWLSDIDYALSTGLRNNESLMTWQTGSNGTDRVRSAERSIKDGIAALQKLTDALRNKPTYVEPPEDYELTSCGCSHPNAAPPCSFCTRPKDEDEE